MMLIKIIDEDNPEDIIEVRSRHCIINTDKGTKAMGEFSINVLMNSCIEIVSAIYNIIHNVQGEVSNPTDILLTPEKYLIDVIDYSFDDLYERGIIDYNKEDLVDMKIKGKDYKVCIRKLIEEYIKDKFRYLIEIKTSII